MVISKKDLKICKFFTGFYKFYITLTELQIKDKRIIKSSGLLGVMSRTGGLNGGGAYGGIQDDDLSYSSDIGKRTSGTKKYFINPTEELINENHNQTYISETTVSTFSIDVDTASYRKIKKTIDTTTNLYDYHFAPEEIRIEEMINYFDYDYIPPENEAFTAVTEVVKSPFEDNIYFLHIGIKGKEDKLETIPPANLIFLVDTSNSMDEENKLSLVKKSLIELTKNLRTNDKISILIYSDDASVLLNPTNGNEKDKITNKINELVTTGSTNGEAGLKLAYKIGKENFIKDGINRIILCSDGDFNSGTININDLKEMIVNYRKEGIALTSLAFGISGYNDSLFEILSNSGNGNYYYIDNFNEAIKVLSNQLISTLNIIAKDVKIQVEFNPENIKSFKLLGYENKLLNKEDFKNDKVDAGEIGNGHSVTAIYQMELNDSFLTEKKESDLKYYKGITIPTMFFDELATLNIRYKKPKEENSIPLNFIIKRNNIINDISKSSNNFRFSLAVAYFGLILKKQVDISTINKIIKLAKENKGEDKLGYKEEFIQLVKSFKEKYREEELVYSGFSKKGQLIIKTGEITGNLTQEQVKKVINNHLMEIRQCYEKELYTNDDLKGIVKLTWKIDPMGDVISAIVTDSTMLDESVESCLTNRIKKWKFPEPLGGGFALVNYPFNFHSR